MNEDQNADLASILKQLKESKSREQELEGRISKLEELVDRLMQLAFTEEKQDHPQVDNETDKNAVQSSSDSPEEKKASFVPRISQLNQPNRRLSLGLHKNEGERAKIEELRRRAETSSPSTVSAAPLHLSPLDERKQLLDIEQVLEIIESSIKVGTPLYEKGIHEQCFKAYQESANAIIGRAKGDQKETYWFKILEKGLEVAQAEKNFKWGALGDPAWIMRFAFESVKSRAAELSGDRTSDFWRNTSFKRWRIMFESV
eukprot:TRINITY_DN1883_c0_g1_i1.p1 TRINITY_DN1883_c0_g1~~TRINITY_DN1883_c0_g1_i1.p1  ORF type:complete len:258 (-),score=92.03 TRINITY_DN1883_c0_g1_i1:61-834(-)